MKRLLPLLLASGLAFAADTPNVVVILSDDLGYGSVGCYGANPDLIRTPNIDRLAKEGRRFTDGNTTSSVCSPTRYAMVTGRYCWRTELKSEVLGTTAPLHIETTRLTIASMLKSKGYATAAVGKWHLGYGTQPKQDFTGELSPGPLDIGFDYHFSVPANHGDLSGVYVEDRWVAGLNRESPTDPSPPYVTMKEQKGAAAAPGAKALKLNAPKRVDESVMDVLTDKACAWLAKQSAAKPFFLYYTPVAVHNPITPSAKTKGSSKAGSFGDWVHELDLSVGQLLTTLEKAGTLDNTLILFTSDNGGVNKSNPSPQTDARNAGLQPVGPFKGGKHDVWEGGFRVPYLVRWPSHVPAGSVCEETVSVVDTLASVASIVGYPLPPAAQAAEDSWDVSKAWLGQSHDTPLRSHLIVHSADGNFAIRRNGSKWIEGIPADDVKPAAVKARKDQFQRQLYHLGTDIAEAKNVLPDHADEAAQLEALLNRYRNGGYSRELPPIVAAPKDERVLLLPDLTGELVVNESLAAMPSKGWRVIGGNWTAKDGALQGGQPPSKKQTDIARLHGPLPLGDGVLQCDLRFDGAERMALRFETADRSVSYRVDVGLGKLGITVNTAPDKGIAEPLDLGTTKIKLKSGEWATLRVTFAADTLTAEFAGAKVMGKHPLLTAPRNGMTFGVHDQHLAIKRVQAAATK